MPDLWDTNPDNVFKAAGEQPAPASSRPGGGAGQPRGWKACSNWRARSREAAHRSAGVMNSTL